MKTDFQDEGWSAAASQRFATTELGQRLVGLLGKGSPQQVRLADYVLRNPVAAAARGIDDLSAAAETSAPTISRFARELGFVSFAEFRATLGDAIATVFDPVTKLRDSFGRDGAPQAAVDSLAAARGHLAALADPATAARIRAVSGRIAAAGAVYTMGFGLSSHLAAMLALGLQPYRDQVINTVQFGGTEVAAGRVMAIGREDLLIAISFPRYAADILHLVRFARDRGVRVVAITDSVASPLARYADDVLLAPALHPILSSSSVAALAVIEALVADFMRSDPAHLERAERLTAALGKYLLREE